MDMSNMQMGGDGEREGDREMEGRRKGGREGESVRARERGRE